MIPQAPACPVLPRTAPADQQRVILVQCCPPLSALLAKGAHAPAAKLVVEMAVSRVRVGMVGVVSMFVMMVMIG